MVANDSCYSAINKFDVDEIARQVLTKFYDHGEILPPKRRKKSSGSSS